MRVFILLGVLVGLTACAGPRLVQTASVKAAKSGFVEPEQDCPDGQCAVPRSPKK